MASKHKGFEYLSMPVYCRRDCSHFSGRECELRGIFIPDEGDWCPDFEAKDEDAKRRMEYEFEMLRKITFPPSGCKNKLRWIFSE